MKRGWLINDKLTTLRGNRTLFHWLIDAIPGLEPVMAPFPSLVEHVHAEAANRGAPDYIIRNASYFGRLNLPGSTSISLLQDPIRFEDPIRDGHQIEVCESSDIVICNSVAMAEELATHTSKVRRVEIIPIGTDFDLFSPAVDRDDRPFQSVVFIGSTDPIKGWHFLMKHIAETQHRYKLILKKPPSEQVPNEILSRVETLTRLTQEEIAVELADCSLAVCTSEKETLHLAGIEAGACGVPIVALNVGIYKDRADGAWGLRATKERFTARVDEALADLDSFSPREYWLSEDMDKDICIKRWKSIVGV